MGAGDPGSGIGLRVAIALSCLTLVAPWLALAQFQMPDPKTMAGIPRPDATLTTGTVTVRVIRGQLSNNIPNHPVLLEVAGTPVTTINTDESGRAEFTRLAPGRTAKAVTVVDGERLESQQFPIPAQGGVRLMLVATDKQTAPPQEAPREPVPGLVVLGEQTRFVVEFQEDALQVFYLVDILNNARAPVKTEAPLMFDMPAGATGTTILEGSSPQAVAKGPRVTVMGPFAPGTTRVQMAYQLEPVGGDVTIRQKLPATLEQLTIVAQKVGDLHLSSPQAPKATDVQAEGGTFIMATGPALQAGTTLEVSLTGVPHHSRVPRIAVLVVAGSVLIVGLGVAVFGGPRVDGRRAEELGARREKLLSDLVRLERQRRAGSVNESRYGSRRRELVRQLERVYGELDAVQG
ncbi:MAG: hypothetical protein HYZ58_14475 [Acidobacteria bacterium]|nr:hypothetical protein [Acidobacteriota bacterium]